MKKHSIEALPIVDKNNNIVSIVLWTDEKSAEKTFKHPCRYYGRRPWNKALPVYENPSQTVDSNREIPVVEHIMNRFNQYGCEQFYLVVNHKKNMIKAYFNETEKL